MTPSRPKVPTDEDARKPAPMSFADLGEIIDVTQLIEVTSLDRKTILNAIHRGDLPAWFPAGLPRLGFRMHRADAEAWFFNDPSRAHTQARA